MDFVRKRIGKSGTQIHRRKPNVKMEDEIGVMHLRVEDSWSHQKVGQKHGTGAPSDSPEGTNHADIFTFGF